MAKVDVEKSSYGAFERLFYIFLIPAIFTMILSGVLLSLFDYDVMNTVLKLGNKIPGLSKVIPDPKEAFPTLEQTATTTRGNAFSQEEQIDELTTALAKKEAEVSRLTSTGKQKDEKIKELLSSISLLEEKQTKKTQTDQEYQQQIRSLAGIYAKMSPSKAAPILENLTLSELLLVLSEMKVDERVRVLEKMDPKIAAEASINLKDIVPAKDVQISALQERLDLYKEQNSSGTTKLNGNELAQTFAGMAPKSAAALLQAMMVANLSTVITILSSLETQPRSLILTALSDLSKEDAAQITAKLAQ